MTSQKARELLRQFSESEDIDGVIDCLVFLSLIRATSPAEAESINQAKRDAELRLDAAADAMCPPTLRAT